MNDLSALQVADEQARRKTETTRTNIEHLAHTTAMRNREHWHCRNAVDALESLTEKAACRRRPVVWFTIKDYRFVMKSALESLKGIGLETIPIYVTTLKADFALPSAWRSIERLLNRSFAKVVKEANAELGTQTRMSERVLANTRKALVQVKADIYRELQIESHALRSKIALKNTRTRMSATSRTPVPDVSFLHDKILRKFATRAATEACRCFDGEAYTAAAIMAGSVMETVLLDALKNYPATRKESGLDGQSLDDLIHQALKTGLLGQSTTQLTYWMKENRNLLHPGRVLRQRRTVEREEAEMCLSILKLICKELRRSAGLMPDSQRDAIS